MLPTSPRALERSTCNSCTTPCSSMATRVSCGVTLIRISCSTILLLHNGPADPGERGRGFCQRQSHHARVTAVDAGDEHCREALNRISASLVEGFAAGDISRDFPRRQAAHRHVRDGQDNLHVVLPAERDCADDIVLAT